MESLMWVKLLLVLAYLMALFLVSRLLETAAWYETGFLSYRILDPFSLSVKKLKRLLETRGISYTGLIEKQELTNLVESSGDVVEGELVDSEVHEKETAVSPPRATHFTGGTHFYEEVEDTKDSIWIVQVIPPFWSALLGDVEWRRLQSRVAPFGVRTGIFDCSVDHRLCQRKGWETPQLILAMPKGHRAKDNVVLHSYPIQKRVRLQPILDWIRNQLMMRVHQVKSIEELQSDWLNYEPQSKKSEIRVLLFSVLLDPPLFLLALGVKFSGRIRVGMVQQLNKEKPKELQELGITRTPTYLVITPEKVFVYGQRIGEYLSYRRMELLLKMLRPEANDVFVLSLILVNLIGSLNLLLVQNTLWRHLIVCFWRLAKANCILFLVWLVFLGLANLIFVEYASECGLKVVRVISSSDAAAFIRHEWQRWRNCPLGLAVSFFAFCSFLSWIWHKWRPQDVSPSESASGNTSEWWSVSLDAYLMDCFFRPIATLTQPLTPTDLDLEEGMELLIERLAVPNLWLHPVVGSDYIKDLPVWTHCIPTSQSEEDTSWGSESDEGSCCATVDRKCSENDETSGDDNNKHSRPTNFCRCLRTSQKSSSSFRSSRSKKNPSSSLLDGHHQQQQPSSRSSNSCQYPFKDASSDQDDDKSQVRSSCTSTTGPPQGVLTCYECAICLDVYKQGAVLCGLPCGHNYHQHCILLWLSRDNHHCPVCRWPTYKSKKKCQLVTAL